MSIADALNTTAARRPLPTPKLDLTSTEARVEGFVTERPIERATDWAPIFRRFNLDPDAFEVVDDTVRMTSWDQSARSGTDDGKRDYAFLYSYSATFRRVTADRIPDATVDQWRAVLVKPPARRLVMPAPAEHAGTYVVLVADPQLGKKGTAEAVDNWKRGVRLHLDAAARLGPAVESVHVAFMGDETENVVNSYGNQPHTIELNRSRQLELDYDMRVWTMREALALGRPVSASSVISNHGEWTRNGGKDVATTLNDNSSTHTARLVKRLFDELDAAGVPNRRIDWTIGDGHPGVTVNLSGVHCYFSHGYVEKGRGTSTETRTRSAIERQILGRTDDLGTVDLWFMAHYHHFYANEFEGRTLFGCPAIEAEKSSEYMLDQFGVWSPPGVLGMLVGEARHRDGWSNLNVF